NGGGRKADDHAQGSNREPLAQYQFRDVGWPRAERRPHGEFSRALGYALRQDRKESDRGNNQSETRKPAKQDHVEAWTSKPGQHSILHGGNRFGHESLVSLADCGTKIGGMRAWIRL